MTKLIDKIKELQATATERAEQKRIVELTRQAEIAEEDSRLGREYATSLLETIRGNILSAAAEGQPSTTITVQTNSTQYELSAYESAYSATIGASLREEGLTVSLLRKEHHPQGASSGQTSYSTYSAYLHVSW
jgi:hypothetical protein